MARRQISDQASATLEGWLDQLLQGQISLGGLPLAVEAWLHAGYALGRDSRQPEIDRLERDCNRYYSLAFTTPQQRREHLEARLAQALNVADETVWDRIEADLAVMAGRQLNIENSLRAGATPERNGVTNDHSSPERSKRAA